MAISSPRLAASVFAALGAMFAAPAALAQHNFPMSGDSYTISTSDRVCEATFTSVNNQYGNYSSHGDLTLRCWGAGNSSSGQWDVTDSSVTFPNVADPLNVLNANGCANGWQGLDPNDSVERGELCWINWSVVESVVRTQ